MFSEPLCVIITYLQQVATSGPSCFTYNPCPSKSNNKILDYFKANSTHSIILFIIRQAFKEHFKNFITT